MQDLARFELPESFRGRSLLVVQLWSVVQSTVFRWSPRFANAFRRWLLRRFGASVGRSVLIRPTAQFTYPWKIRLGDNVWIGEDVVLYSLGEIEVGSNTVISQQSYLCTGSHDYSQDDFPIYATRISIGAEVWICAGVFVAPGVTVGRGTVVGARSLVLHDMPAGMVCYGHPCRPMRTRETRTA